jgi:hypothetical protein
LPAAKIREEQTSSKTGTHLEENLVLQIFWTGQVSKLGTTFNRCLDQGLSEDFVHDIHHLVLLGKSAVNLGRDEERVRRRQPSILVDCDAYVAKRNLGSEGFAVEDDRLFISVIDIHWSLVSTEKRRSQDRSNYTQRFGNRGVEHGCSLQLC